MRERKRNEKKRKQTLLRVTALAIPLVLLLLSQTALAQNTYVITDGDRVVFHTSTASDPAEVLTEAGLALGEDDTYTTQPGIVGSEITIRRSQLVTVNNRGEIFEVNSTQETVAQLLQQLNIPLEDMTVSVPLSAETYDGMEIVVSHTVRATETYTACIPHETAYFADAALPYGTEVVITEGADGQALCTADVVYVEGKEISRTVTEETVITQPVQEVVAVGTGSESRSLEQQRPVIGDGMILLPTGEVLTYYGSHKVLATAYTHTDPGCDFITATGTTVRIGTVAVDPTLIPYGTRMFIVTDDGQYIYGIATAEDCGGGIKGDRIDLYFPTYDECMEFGRRPTTIYFLG